MTVEDFSHCVHNAVAQQGYDLTQLILTKQRVDPEGEVVFPEELQQALEQLQQQQKHQEQDKD